MAGYAVSERIDRPRLRAGGLVAAAWTDRATMAAVLEDDLTRAGSPRPTLAERWEDAQRVWRQTTFYLFDPDSWR